MPRTVDHEERRSKILEAFMAVAAREGLHATSLRAVAVEAGISLRSVQYYFDTKVGLMQAGLAALENQSNERLRTRLGGLESSSSARERLQALFAIALPTDLESRRFHLLWTSYAMLAMTDQVISDRAFVDSPNRLKKRIVSLLEEGKSRSEIDASRHSEIEASLLIALIHGLGTAVLVGHQTAESAYSSFDHYLDRLASEIQ